VTLGLRKFAESFRLKEFSVLLMPNAKGSADGAAFPFEMTDSLKTMVLMFVPRRWRLRGTHCVWSKLKASTRWFQYIG